MRNAGASIDPPTDPFAAVPLPSRPVRPGARDPSVLPGEQPKGGSRLPPGVSPDIFGPSGAGQPAAPSGFGRPAGSLQGAPGLPPVAPPPQPWQMAAPPERSLRQHDETASGGPQQPESPHFTEPPRRRGRRSLLAVVVLLLLAGLAYAVPAIIMSGKMLPGTRVHGVDIGGLTATEAADKLRDRLQGKVGEEMTLLAAGRKYSLDPENAGLEFDIVATIGQASSGFPGPMDVWRALTGTTELAPQVSVDPEHMDSAVTALAKKIDLKVREGEVTFKGTKPVVVTPRDGHELEREAAAGAIRKAFLGAGGEVELPVSVIKPKATEGAVEKAAADAGKALSGPVTLTSSGRQAQLPVDTLAAHLSFKAESAGSMVPVFDAKNAVAAVENKLVDPAQAPQEPTFRIVGTTPELVPGRSGKGINDEKLADAVTRMVTKGGSRTIPVVLTNVNPRVSDAEARKLGIEEKISEFTTPYACCVSRVTNIRTIAKLLDGYLVKPGETFSLNGVIGQRDAARGFVPAPMIEGGRLVDSVGGGISQFVTTMYNAVFFGGLEDVQHVAHEFYISRYPAGRESTVSWPGPDFRWKNDSKYGVLVKTSSTATSVTVAFWSTKRYDIESLSSQRYDFTPFRNATGTGPSCLPMVGQQGFTIDVTRVFKQEGKEVKRETKKTVYKPETNLTCTSTSGPAQNE
ncbi:vancomycin resistance protein YoaR [Streptosporangium album]|uniref:Vancomycin resistance protein YoaR n=1 Tax=Streptosporangium album TaxID=47479 RepID=A0A7W7RRZ3_9ACTN|nr:VanW family protein [Streptosporangium album]MBB4937114.1 vancomycin resistance protein YoaR [Streptosporangium album]